MLRKNSMRHHVLLLLIFAGSQLRDAHAGGVTNATITQVVAESPNGYFVYVDLAPTNTPACGTVTSGNHRYVIDLTTDAGKAMIATVLTAYANKALIDITGTGTCDVWGDTETVYYITAHQQ
jgi:hypothetical protein